MLSAAARGRPADRRRPRERPLQERGRRREVDQADEGAADRRDRPHRARRSTGRTPNTVYALVTAQRGQGGFFRSDDAGASWTRIGRSVSDGRPGRRRRRRTRWRACDASGRVRAAIGRERSAASSRSARAGRRTRRDRTTTAIAAAIPATTTRSSSTGTIRKRSGRRRPTCGAARTAGRPGRPCRCRACTSITTTSCSIRRDTEPHHHRQRRRPVRDLRRDEDVAALHEPAAVAVLPRERRQREAVLQRLRRHAGQRIHLRSVAHAQPCRHPDERLVQHRRRRRVPDAQRSGESEHRLRRVAGRQPAAARPRDRRAPQHAPARRSADLPPPPAAPADAAAPAAARRAGRPRRRAGATGRWHWDSPTDHQPALRAARLRRRPPRLSQRRSRRQLDRRQRRPDAEPRSG